MGRKRAGVFPLRVCAFDPVLLRVPDRLAWRDTVGRSIVGSLVAAFLSVISLRRAGTARRLADDTGAIEDGMFSVGARSAGTRRHPAGKRPPAVGLRIVARSRGEGLGYAGSVAPSFLVLDFYVFFLSPCFIEIVCADFRASVHMFYVPVLDFRCFRFFRMKFFPA